MFSAMDSPARGDGAMHLEGDQAACCSDMIRRAQFRDAKSCLNGFEVFIHVNPEDLGHEIRLLYKVESRVLVKSRTLGLHSQSQSSLPRFTTRGRTTEEVFLWEEAV